MPGLVVLLERVVLEGFWEEVAFQPGLDGEMQLSCAKTSGRSVTW